MRRLIGLLALVLMAALLLLVACSESGPTNVGGSVTLTAAESMEGNQVRIELRAAVLGADGIPAKGEQVTFEATAGEFVGSSPAAPRRAEGVTDETGVVEKILRTAQTDRVLQIVARAGGRVGSVQIGAEGTQAVLVAEPEGSQVVGQPVTFDGSGSMAAEGFEITMYRWTITSSDPDPGDPEEEIIEATDATTVERTYENPQELTVTLDVSDDPDAEDLLAAGEDVPYASSQTIEYDIVPANEPPVADAGEDRQAECSGGGSATVTLDGSGSSDPDSSEGTNDDIVSFEWYEDYGLGTEMLLGEGETLEVALAVGSHEITLVVTDSADETDTDVVLVEIVDMTPPSGSITFPADGACLGPADLPVTVQDDFTDVCTDELVRTYEPAPGPGYTDHGDYTVTLTVTDPSGNSASDSVSFAIDTETPVVQILTPEPNTYINPSMLPFSMFFETGDGDGSGGGIVHERVLVDDCVMYDGDSYGDGDGLLSDEMLEFSVAELCRLTEQCGLSSLDRPELRVEASDCGGNTGYDTARLAGSLQLLPGVCE